MKPTMKRIDPQLMFDVSDGEQVAIVAETQRRQPDETLLWGFRRHNVGVFAYRRDGGGVSLVAHAEYRPAYRAAVQYAEGMAKEAGQILGI